MRIILTKNIPNIGRAGEVKDLSAGYVRNFVLPRAVGRILTPQLAAQWERKEAKASEQAKRVDAKAEKTAIALRAITLKIHGKANDQGTLYAQIQPATVVKALQQRLGPDVVAKSITGLKDVTKLGSHQVTVVLADGTSAQVQLRVKASNS